jgi:cold shock protein
VLNPPVPQLTSGPCAWLGELDHTRLKRSWIRSSFVTLTSPSTIATQGRGAYGGSGTEWAVQLLYRAERRGVMTGSIRTIRAEKGFGFIKDDAGKEYFFHRSAVYGEGLEDLREGDSVEFDLGEGPKGPRAENVRRTST